MQNKFKIPEFKEKKYKFTSPKLIVTNKEEKAVSKFVPPKNSFIEQNKLKEKFSTPKFEFNKKPTFKFKAPKSNLNDLNNIKQTSIVETKLETIEDKITEEFLNFDNSETNFKIPKIENEIKENNSYPTDQIINKTNTTRTKLLEKITFKNLFSNKNK